MTRIVIRPRIQIPVLVVVFGAFALLGFTFFTNGHVVARREWFGIILGGVCVVGGVVGIWRSLRLGVVIDENGIRTRNLDRRDDLTPWSDVRSIECEQVGVRAGMSLYAPVLHINDRESLPVSALGSYSRADAEAKTQKLRSVQQAT